MLVQPFTQSVVEDVANARNVDEAELRGALSDVQAGFERDDDGYEYSSEQNFAWSNENAFFLYGAADVWGRIRDDHGLAEELADAVREVHARTMLESASERDQEVTVREMFDDGNEPIVVDSMASDAPGFGLDV